MSVYDVIRETIIHKQQVVATYDGHVREMCPHVLGTKDGREQALFYQFGGTSGSRPIGPSGSHANWRCIPIDGLRDVSVRNGSKRQNCVDRIDVAVENDGR